MGFFYFLEQLLKLRTPLQLCPLKSHLHQHIVSFKFGWYHSWFHLVLNEAKL